ncbi:response regulator transcription factor [Paenibacillus aestuarii]|uniref:Response regulator transcription factor n=1 Tax=Paenibacillus aestuarii TaxID=516965 RepID=A0ABW0K3R1_9BACL|nr:response regulator transcription factor [Paenibacillus aestuarii]
MKVLLIEDETVIGDMIAMYLADEHHAVQRVDNGTKGLEAIREFDPDIAIIDCFLPDINGIELCKQLREISYVPIIMISMNTDVSNRIDALLAGADDYMCKPFSMKELSARVAAQMRRVNLSIQFEQNKGKEKLEAYVSVDKGLRRIIVNGHEVDTTFSEFEIMYLFDKNPGRVFTREELITYLRGNGTLVSSRAIDVYMTKLRNKIEKDPKNPQFIKTVWGLGYKYSKG